MMNLFAWIWIVEDLVYAPHLSQYRTIDEQVSYTIQPDMDLEFVLFIYPSATAKLTICFIYSLHIEHEPHVYPLWVGVQ